MYGIFIYLRIYNNNQLHEGKCPGPMDPTTKIREDDSTIRLEAPCVARELFHGIFLRKNEEL